uniref:Uncharacterized protein n=1 Tax=Parascaris equorum TaxID=6256 RepID=A0A914RVM7_PAREQ
MASMEKIEMKEMPKAAVPDAVDVEKAIKRAIEAGTTATKQQENPVNVCVESGMKESDDDDDFSATYYFMQPEWASLYPPERKKNPEAVEEHYASEGLEKDMVSGKKKRISFNCSIVP